LRVREVVAADELGGLRAGEELRRRRVARADAATGLRAVGDIDALQEVGGHVEATTGGIAGDVSARRCALTDEIHVVAAIAGQGRDWLLAGVGLVGAELGAAVVDVREIQLGPPADTREVDRGLVVEVRHRVGADVDLLAQPPPVDVAVAVGESRLGNLVTGVDRVGGVRAGVVGRAVLVELAAVEVLVPDLVVDLPPEILR